MVGNRILNNYVMEFVGFENWELVLVDEADCRNGEELYFMDSLEGVIFAWNNSL